MKVALVYDRVNKWGGAERVLLALHELFPEAILYTSVYDKKEASWAKVFPKIETSFLQKLPFAKNNHEFLAPFMPFAFSLFDFSGYDLVISITSESAKSIKVDSKTLHICYCLTPTRYLWSGYDLYFRGWFLKFLTSPIVKYLRKLDILSAKNPDLIVAISHEVKHRIRKYYHRDSVIVFPPVNSALPSRRVKINKSHYLVVSRLDYGYKRVELVIETFNKLNYPLVVVGKGREENRLKQISKNNIKFVGKVSDIKLSSYYKNAKALIMPQIEDFGIVSIEAQSYGVPVIAFNKGGSIDTVKEGVTGVFFNKQNISTLKNAILRFENMTFKADNLITNAKKFSKENFKKNFARIVKLSLKRKRNAN